MYREQLPANCPCKEAEDADGYEGYRLLSSAVPKDHHFDSVFMLDPDRFKGKSSEEICRAKSVSLVSMERAQQVIRVPKMKKKFTHIGFIKLTKGCGKAHKSHEDHTDWWPLKSTKVLSLVAEVDAL